MSALVTARLLGPPQVLIDGASPPPELLWRKHLALCIALWTAPESRRSRDQLIGLLWSDKTEGAARHSLNEALRVIRRAVGDDAVDSSGDSVCWRAPVQLDLKQFVALEHGAPVAAADLITGPFCDGLVVAGAQEFDAWLATERERWQTRSVDVLVRAATAAEDRGDARCALVFAQRATILNGLSELAAQSVIRAHWVGGDRGAAVAAGEAYRRRIERELGLELDERTATLIARVGRERRPSRPPSAVVVERRSPLIGRDTVLHHLLDSLRTDASPARPKLLIVSGAAGSGRSRVLEETVSRAVMTGATVVTMRAVDADVNDADAAVLGLASAGLDAAPGVAGAPPSALAAFVARVPSWAERFRSVPVADVGPLRAAFIAVVLATAEERPVMLAVDDADRLHPDELRWFAALLRSLPGRSVALLLTTTTGTGSPAIDELIGQAGRDIAGVAERLGALTQAHLQELVEWALPDWSAEAQDRLARRMLVESAGLPAIAVDVLVAVQHGLPIDGDTSWPARDRTLDATLPGPLPEPLVASIRVAFRRLSTDAQSLVTVVALLDEPSSADRVGRIAAIEDPARRDAALDELEWDGWLALDGRGYSFPARAKRRLIGREMLTPGQRRRLEDRIAACP